MNAVVLGSSELAKAVKRGVEKVMPLSNDGEIVFCEPSEALKLEGKKIALFGSFVFSNFDKTVEKVKEKNVVLDSLFLKKSLFSNFSEVDLVRAEAFGEKIARRLLGLKAEKGTEKSSRIKGYVKASK
ncbi:hypothetical protein HUU53_02400 [Candidatus Micrarchaeota archaeon]|nr:hypothetical protein [Candidatus Micrarchaeota archaeon]